VAAKPAPSTIKPDRLAAYDRVIEMMPGLVRKGASIPYTSVNGNMFSYLFGEGSLALRLSVADRDSFLARFGTRLHEAYGIVQKEYVDVPDTLLDDTSQLASWFASSYEYASGLKPKPTTRKPKPTTPRST
jgi:TfoX/Sxy family transcriptional regulator of competence genes